MSDPPKEPWKEQVELEVGRCFKEDAGKHRTHLETQFKRLSGALGILALAIVAGFYWFLGNSRSEVQGYVEQSVEARFLDYQFDTEMMAQLGSRIEKIAEKEAKSEDTKAIIIGIINSYIGTPEVAEHFRTLMVRAASKEANSPAIEEIFDSQIGARVSAYLDEKYLPALRAAANEKIDEMKRLNLKALLRFPVGTIVPYAGSVLTQGDVPPGWLLCNGRPVPDGEAYDELRDLLQTTAWGRDGAVVLLPELRGMFLRGVDDPDGESGEWPAAGNDKDPAARYVRITRQENRRVGSVQDFATGKPSGGLQTKETTSAVVLPWKSVALGGKSADMGHTAKADGATPLTLTIPRLAVEGYDSETRPLNAYVNFIIKH